MIESGKPRFRNARVLLGVLCGGFLFEACSSDDAPSNKNDSLNDASTDFDSGSDGSVKDAGTEHDQLVLVDQEPPGDNCPNGGVAIKTGADLNDNGTLEASEITSTSYVCNGAGGDAGSHVALIRLDAEPTGVNCANGGLAVKSGLDLNDNGTLDDDEITSTSYVCNGGTGDAGTSGANTLVRVDVEPAGANCASGGVAVKTGLDQNGNGTLEDAEVESTSYVCSVPGKNVLVRLDPVPPGPNCPAGGTAIKTGVDTNSSGTLEESEVTSTSYVCNAPPLGAGGVLMGSFTIHNSLDVTFLQQFTEVTGDVGIDAPGLQSISLPALTKVGQRIYSTGNGVPDLASLDLPALKTAGAIFIDSGKSLTTLNVPLLQAVTDDIDINAPSMTSVAFPNLVSVKYFRFAVDQGTGTVPKLSGSTDLGIELLGLTIPWPTLATAGYINMSGVSAVDLPALTTVGQIGIYGVTPIPITLPLLTTSGGFGVTNATTLTAPKLTSIGSLGVKASSDVNLPALTSISDCSSYGGVHIDAGAGNIALTSLESITCDGLAVSTTGSFAAPALTTSKGLRIVKVSGLDLSALKSGGRLGFEGVGLATLELPALTNADLVLGYYFSSPVGGYGCTDPPNAVLTKIEAPNLTSGFVLFVKNPLFPKCRADALMAQLGGQGKALCPLAAGPCP